MSSLEDVNRVLEALRATQKDQGEKIDANFAELKSDVAEIKVGIFQLVRMLEGLGGPQEPSGDHG